MMPIEIGLGVLTNNILGKLSGSGSSTLGTLTMLMWMSLVPQVGYVAYKLRMSEFLRKLGRPTDRAMAICK